MFSARPSAAMQRFRHLRTSHRGWRRTPVRTYLFGVLSLLLLAAVVPIVGFADGSRTAYPTNATCGTNGSCRAAIEWSASAYGPTASQVLRRTLFTVYLQAGEILETGSSAVGVGSGDTWVWRPGRITDDQGAIPGVGATAGSPDYKCSDQRALNGAPATQGQITSRTQEQGGPQAATDTTARTTSYIPCTYTAPETGLYKLAFIGPSGANAASTGNPPGDVNLTNANNFTTSQGTHVSAWDATVRSSASSTTDIAGRLFTYVLSAQTGGNNRPLTFPIYATTLDGFVYRADMNGLDPNAFLIYGNERGFLDPDGTTPLYHDVLGHENAVTTVDGGVAFAAPQYPISLTPLSDLTLGAISVPTTPTAPTMTNFRFNGSASGQHTYPGRGGTFTFDAGAHGTYDIVISRDGSNFDPSLGTNRVLRAVINAGARSVAWDGKDNAGNAFPVGTNYAVHANLHAGVYHFPLVDAENSVNGGLASFTLTNPPNNTCAFGGAAADCSRAFYDDRGYYTSTGSVGTPGSVLCGLNPPAAPSSDPVDGYVSTTNRRAFGASDGSGNATTPGNCSTGQFGDAKALDTWTFYPSTTQDASFAVNAVPSTPQAGDITATTPTNTVLDVPASDAKGLITSSTGTNITVTSHTTPTNGGSVTTTPQGRWTFTPATNFSGTSTFDYTITDDAGQTDNGTVTVTVTPTAGNDTASTTANTPKNIAVLANDHGSSLTVNSPVTSAPGHGTAVVRANNTIDYTPATGYSGQDTFDYTVTDASGQTATATVTVDVTPLAPDYAVTTTATTTVSVDAKGGATGSSLSVSHTDGSHGTVTDDGTGTLTYHPSGTFSGTDTFTYTVTDPDGEHASGTVTVTVTPVVVQDDRTTPINTSVTLDPTADDHGTNKSLGGVGTPSHGSVVVSGNNVTYTPATDFVGTDSFTYTLVADGGSDPSGVVTIHVKPRSPDDSYTIDAGDTLSPDAAHGVLANDTPGLHVVRNTAPAAGTGSVTVNPDGSFTYNPPNADFSGRATFTYTAATSDGVEADPATVTITVLPTALPQNYGATAGQPLTVDQAHGVLNGSHGTTLQVSPSTITTVAGGTVSMNPDGSFTYTAPTPNYSGADSFSYTITDASGNTITQTADVVVAPDAVDDGPVTVRTGGAVTVPVLTNDHGTNKTVSAVVDGSHGTVSTNGTTVTYTPNPAYSGPDSFTYTLTGDGGSDTATVTINVGPHAVDDGPITTTAGSSVAIPVVANDEGDNLAVSGTSTPGHGTVTISQDGQSVTYTPTSRYSGDDSFTYTLTGTGGTDTATVTIRVNPQAVGDTGSVAADGTLDVPAASGVLANDLATTPTVTAHTDPAHGTLVIRANGSYVYTPDAGYSGPDSFSYTLTDAAGRTSAAVVNLTVTATAPADDYSTNAGTLLTVPVATGVLSNDSGNPHVTGHTLVNPFHGTLTLNNDGSFSYDPSGNPNFSGTDTFTYTAQDASGQNTGPTTVRIFVRPVGVADNYPGVAGTDLVVTDPTQGVLANDQATSPSATPTTNALTSSGGHVDLNADGTFSYRPPTQFSGTDTFTYNATDASGQAYTQTVSIVVAPKAADDPVTVAAGTTTATTVTVLSNDVGSGLVVSLGGSTTSVHGGAISTDGTTVSYTPPAGFSGDDTFSYTVSDSHGQTATATVSVTVNPTAANESVSTPIGTPITVDEVANDHVRSPTVTVTTAPTHGGYVIESDQRITYSPGAGFSGVDTIGYTVTDPDGRSATATITVTVTPTAVDDTITTNANQAATKNVVANDGGTGLQVTGTTTPAHGTVTVSTDQKSVTYTPTAEFSGNDSFDYTVSDGTTSRTATVRVTVLPTGADDAGTTVVNTTRTVTGRTNGVLNNDHGTLSVTGNTNGNHGGTAAVSADGSYTYTPAAEFSGVETFTYTATDGAGRTVTQTVAITVTPTAAADTATAVSDRQLTVPARGVLVNDHGTNLATSAPTTSTHGGAVSMAADGSYTYTSPTKFSGTDTFTYTVSDGTTTRTATVTITVNPVADDDTGSTPYNTPLTVAGPGVLANDHGSVLSVVGNTQPQHGSVTVGTGGGYTYTPTAGYSGTDSFDYTAQDSSGRRTTATVHLAVGLVAADDAYTTPADTRLTVAAPGVLANDNGTGLQVTGTTQPPHGTVSVGTDGALVFVPEANWSGRETFEYSVQDSSGGTTSATVHLVVTPRAVGDTGSTVVGTALHVGGAGTPGNLLANDRGTGLSVTASTAPDHGTVTVNPDGSYDYTPPAGYSGPDSFTYTVTDGAGGTNTALVLLTVKPAAADDDVTTPVDTPVAFTPVANDHGTSLAVTSVTQPAHGTATVVNGGIRFTPDHGWSGITTCNYTATDSSGQTVTATVTIRVTPVAVADRARTGQGIPVTLDSVVNDRGSGLQVTDVAQPPAAQGTVVIRDGRLVFRPADGFTGTATFTYTVTDAAGQTTTATDTVVVSPLGDADPDEATTTENNPVTVDPTANDPGHATFVMSTLQLRDPKTGVLATTVTVKGQGTYVVDPHTGKVTFTPVKGFHGTADPITYQVLDQAGALHVSTIEITVTQAAASTTATGGSGGSGGTGGSSGSGGSDLPGTGSPIGWQVPIAGLLLLVAGLVLTLRRRREPVPVRVKGGSRRATTTSERGTHRQR